MVQERNVVSGVVATGLAPFVNGWQELLAWCVVAVVLILADLKFGIEAARKRGDKIRGSRAVRRTINKLVDYLCWISIAWILGGSFGHIFGLPLIPAIVMLGVCLIELSSIVDNYCEVRGIKKRLNAFKLFFRLIKHPELEDCMEEVKDENKPERN
ncbi:MAG: phage holin family protein [Bacteroidales bacterium]|nr:phage holin family protein [Candidatus Egerieousia equi]